VDAVSSVGVTGSAKVPWYRNPKVLGIVYQVLLAALVVGAGYELVSNAVENLRAQKIATGFGFWDNQAGFGITQSLIPYNESSTYGDVFWVGLLNTLMVSAVGVFFATIIGFLVGIGRLSKNWVVARLSYYYVEAARNLPLLFQIFFWYAIVVNALPQPRNAYEPLPEVFLSVRGLYMPRPIYGNGFDYVVLAFVVSMVFVYAIRRWAADRQEKTGQQFPVLWVGLAVLFIIPFIVFALLGFPLSFEFPELKGFNFDGGIRVIPEFVALLVALATSTAGFIAEIVRAGIMAVSHGQTEASYSLGMKPGPTLRLVVIPQAMRVIIPPLTGQYLNLTKNSTLAVAIGYPDLFAVFTGTVLNQTGQAIEIIAITMTIYLLISLITSAFMNWYNKRVALVER
jgi:general L-amino acid transport system permease protein